MTLQEVMAELASMGDDNTKKVLTRHGAREPFYGVKVQDLKKIQKRVKKDYPLSMQLFNTGNSDAMYLAGLIADEQKMTKEDLNRWAEGAYWYYLSEYTVAWIAAESRYGWELATEWINSQKENIASTGWATLSSLVAIRDDSDLDLKRLESLLDRVAKELLDAPNRIRYTMNGFVIACGSYVPALTEKAKRIAGAVGVVSVDMGGTACKVPDAVNTIEKVEQKGRLGKKKKTARC